MNERLKEFILSYIETNIVRFHEARLDKLRIIRLNELIKRKNPYLFRAKQLNVANDLITELLNAYLSSQEETIFGNWLEGLAIEVCSFSYSGRKSTTTGIDLEFEKDNTRFLVSIKSGPSWGNASQISRMAGYFAQAKRTFNTSGNKVKICFVNGCCYGKDNSPIKTENNLEYIKACGQAFWYLISGEVSLYSEIIEPLGQEVIGNANNDFIANKSRLINNLTLDFIRDYCFEDGRINWERLIQINSGYDNLEFFDDSLSRLS